METPIPDTYAFYSNQEKTIHCPDNDYKLPDGVGILRFLERCVLRTPNVYLIPTVEQHGRIETLIIVDTDAWVKELDVMKNITERQVKLFHANDLDLRTLMWEEYHKSHSFIEEVDTMSIIGWTVSITVIVILAGYLYFKSRTWLFNHRLRNIVSRKGTSPTARNSHENSNTNIFSIDYQ